MNSRKTIRYTMEDVAPAVAMLQKGGLVQLFPHYDPCSRASCSAFFWACSSASRR